MNEQLLIEITSRIGKRFPVYAGDENSWIELLDVSPHPASGITPDEAIVQAARASYNGESKGAEKDKRLLFYLMKNEHSTPFEMASFKIRLSLPVVAAWQMVRHRTLSLNSSSGRYVEFEEDKFYIPPANAWRKQSTSNKQGSSDEVLSDKDFEIIRSGINQRGWGDFGWDAENMQDLLRDYIDLGYSIYKSAIETGAAKEQARFFLPAWSSYYTWVVNCDLRNWMNFLRLRLHPHAQYEIRAYAETIYNEIFKPCFTWSAEAFEEFVLNLPPSP